MCEGNHDLAAKNALSLSLSAFGAEAIGFGRFGGGASLRLGPLKFHLPGILAARLDVILPELPMAQRIQ